MTGIARKDKKDTVHTPDGTGANCASPSTYHTNIGSDNVFVENIGAVREGDAMEEHPEVGCSNHSPTLSTFSNNVYVNGKRVGRIGDAYGEGKDHIIQTGATTVFANGK
jgi:uncharacterized Zn-binding protein involved in type VI secretion